MCSGEISIGRDNILDADEKDSGLFLSDINQLSELWANRQHRDHGTREFKFAKQLATRQDAEEGNDNDNEQSAHSLTQAATSLFDLWSQFVNQRPIFQQNRHKIEERPRKRHKTDIARDQETEEQPRTHHKADVTRDHKTEERPRERHKADIARDHEVPPLNMLLHPSPNARNSADDAHYQELELDLMNKARHKTQTVDEFWKIAWSS